MTRILDRYVLRLLIGPLSIGLTVFTFILLVDVLFDLAEIIVQRDVPPRLVLELLLWSLPHIVVLTLPMALLFAILIVVGKLSADSELVALRAAGVSLFSLFRPIGTLAVGLTLLNCYLMMVVLPWGNKAQQRIQLEVLNRNVSRQIDAARFYDELDGRILYIADHVADGDRWFGIFMAPSILPQKHSIQIAQYGSVSLQPDSAWLDIRLQNAWEHEIDLAQPADYTIRQHRTLELPVEDQTIQNRRNYSRNTSARTLTIPELQQWLEDPERSEFEKRRAAVEIQKKFSIPAACLVFALFGVPLGFDNRRGGRSWGFSLSILIILAYQLLLSNGERGAIRGDMPAWLAMWLPNIIFFLIGLFVLVRRNRDKSLLLGRLDHWIREGLWGRINAMMRLRKRRQHLRRTQRLQRLEALGEKAPRTFGWSLVLRFPNLLDRYLLTSFFRVFLLVTMGSVAIYVISNFTDRVDDVLKNDASVVTVFHYYRFLFFQIFSLLSPILVLLSVLVTFGILSHSNELTVTKAIGVSLYRSAVPIIFAGIALAGLSALLESRVLPWTNRRADEYEARIQGDVERRVFRRADQQWLYGQGGYIFHFQFYDDERQTLHRLHAFRLDPEHFEMTGRLYAETARYEDGRWLVTNGWMKEFEGMAVTQSQLLPGPVPVDLPQDPSFFSTELKPPEYMRREELRTYIQTLEAAGQEVPHLRVQFEEKYARPASTLVMALVALPFAFRVGRRGALYGVGLALILGISYFALNAFFTTLGNAAILAAPVAVWAPNVIFGSFSIYLFLGIDT